MTENSEQEGSTSSRGLIPRVVKRLRKMGLWHLLWISVLLSEALTAASSTVVSLLVWGEVLPGIMLVGFIDAFWVSLIVTAIIVGIFREFQRHEHDTATLLSASNDTLQEEITERTLVEDELEESLSHLELIIDRMPMGFISWDTEFRVEGWNRQAEAIFGFSAKEAMGKHPYELIVPKDAMPHVKAIWERLLSGDTTAHSVNENFTKDGSTILCQWSNTPIRDKGGSVAGVLSMVQDITERRRAEEQVMRNEKFLTNILDSVQDGVSILDRKLNIVRVNKAMEKWYSHAMPLVGKKCHIAYHGAERACEPCPSLRTLKGGEASTDVVPYDTPEGSAGWLELHTFPYYEEGFSEPAGVIEFVRDITARRRAEEAAQDAHERMKAVMDSIEAVVYVADMQTYELLFINRFAKQNIGALEGKVCWQTLQVGQSGPCDFCTNKHLVDSDGNSLGDYRWEFRNTMNGHWYDVHDKAIPWTDGRLVRLEIAMDITRRKEAEEELARKSEQIGNIFNNLPEAFFSVDMVDHQVLLMSPACDAIYGYPPEAFYENHMLWRDVIHPEDRHVVDESHPDLMRGEPITQSYRIIRPDKSIAWVDSTITPSVGDGGEVTRIDGIVSDITERKQAEEEIKSYSRFLGALMNTIPSPLFYKDEQGVYLGCNDAFLEFMHKGREEIVGKGVYDLAPRELADKYHEMDRELLENPGTQEYEASVIDAQGEKHEVIFNKATFTKADGSVGGLIGLILDITERKRAEEEVARSLREKEVLLKEIHHRVKNNMAIIVSLLSLQSHQTEDDSLRLAFHDSQSRIRSMALVHEKLYQSSDFEHIDCRGYFDALLGSIIRTFGASSQEISSRLEVQDLSLDIDTLIPCGLIVNELVSNSLKYAFKEGEQGEICVSLSSDETGLLSLGVSDNGCGLPKGLDPDKTTSLGLRLVSTLVGQLGGKLSISGKGGAAFTITFMERARGG